MKKLFVTPVCTIVSLEAEDILTLSDVDMGYEDNEGELPEV